MEDLRELSRELVREILDLAEDVEAGSANPKRVASKRYLLWWSGRYRLWLSRRSRRISGQSFLYQMCCFSKQLRIFSPFYPAAQMAWGLAGSSLPLVSNPFLPDHSNMGNKIPMVPALISLPSNHRFYFWKLPDTYALITLVKGLLGPHPTDFDGRVWQITQLMKHCNTTRCEM